MLYDQESNSRIIPTGIPWIKSHPASVSRWSEGSRLGRQVQYHVQLRDVRSVCYYYCLSNNTSQAIDLFCVLILSLLEQLPSLKKPFYEWYKQAQASGNLDLAIDCKKLREFLQNVIETLDRPLFILIDGLDECDRASRKSVLELLRTLSQKTPRLQKTVLSSRRQVEIMKQLDEAAQIDIESDAPRDRVIVEKIVEHQLRPFGGRQSMDSSWRAYLAQRKDGLYGRVCNFAICLSLTQS
ncbi:hypothetical protein F4809DRAFT_262908 [Biscogniauxia mediterranea]|nr:hypothetical protein F4809DRAFT_262908 [Biscogniauxia mediterranea]